MGVSLVLTLSSKISPKRTGNSFHWILMWHFYLQASHSVSVYNMWNTLIRTKVPALVKRQAYTAEQIAEARVRLYYCRGQVQVQSACLLLLTLTCHSRELVGFIFKDQKHALCHPKGGSSGWGSSDADLLAWWGRVPLPISMAERQLPVFWMLPAFCKSSETSPGSSRCEH